VTAYNVVYDDVAASSSATMISTSLAAVGISARDLMKEAYT